MTHRLEITCAAADGGVAAVAPHSLGLTRKTTTVRATAQCLPISVLDLVPTRAGEPARRAIARSVELARHVEQLGYKRYWVAEHHAIQGLACSATPVLIGHIAAGTKTIRVGSGGVMLPNHAPLAVAEQFGTLEAIYPGRIDLGLGRAPGGARGVVLILSGGGADPTGRSRIPYARYKGEAEEGLLASGSLHVYIFRPAYIYPVEPRKEPNFSYRLFRVIYPAFRLLFPNQVIRADDLARAMVDVAVWTCSFSSVGRECSSKHGRAAFRLLFRGLILNDIPMFREFPGFDTHNISGNPIDRSTEIAKPPVHNHEVSFGHDGSRLVLQRWGKALDEIEQPPRPSAI